MAIAFSELRVISRYRVRMRFTNTLAAGAFATGFYAFESLDSQGATPTVTEAFVVENHPDSVEVALDVPLVEGAQYQLSLGAGVPATDLSTAASAEQPFTVPRPRKTSTGSIDDLDAYVFQRDLAHDGEKFLEDPSGDLATLAGPENAMRAINRRLAANGLPWRPDYGARARRFIDAPTGAREELRHELSRAALLDDRVKRARVDAIDDPATGDMSPDIFITLVDDVPRQLAKRP